MCMRIHVPFFVHVLRYICVRKQRRITMENKNKQQTGYHNYKLIKDIHYNSDGSMRYCRETEYDNNGNQIKSTSFKMISSFLYLLYVISSCVFVT